jgi:hypothetical protein
MALELEEWDGNGWLSHVDSHSHPPAGACRNAILSLSTRGRRPSPRRRGRTHGERRSSVLREPCGGSKPPPERRRERVGYVEEATVVLTLRDAHSRDRQSGPGRDRRGSQGRRSTTPGPIRTARERTFAASLPHRIRRRGYRVDSYGESMRRPRLRWTDPIDPDEPRSIAGDRLLRPLPIPDEQSIPSSAAESSRESWVRPAVEGVREFGRVGNSPAEPS